MAYIDINDIILDKKDREDINYNLQYFSIAILIIIITITISFYLYPSKDKIKNKEIFIKKEEIIIKKKEKKISKVIKKYRTKNIKKIEPASVVKKELSNNILENKNYRYIQIGIFKKNIDNKTLSKLEGNNIKYITKDLKNYSKILVGPYDNYQEAKKDILKIKDIFRKDAFITKK